MVYVLEPLPYAYNALEPYFDEQTMKLHHDKHHQTYVDKLNAALEVHKDLQNKSRAKIWKLADYIVPGHGDMFKVDKSVVL